MLPEPPFERERRIAQPVLVIVAQFSITKNRGDIERERDVLGEPIGQARIDGELIDLFVAQFVSLKPNLLTPGDAPLRRLRCRERERGLLGMRNM